MKVFIVWGEFYDGLASAEAIQKIFTSAEKAEEAREDLASQFPENWSFWIEERTVE